MSVDSNKVYFGFTEHKDRVPEYVKRTDMWSRKDRREGTTARATVAMQKHGSVVRLGVVVCSEEDNFSRKVGREKAEARMNSTEAEMFQVPDSLSSRFKDDHELMLYLLRNKVRSLGGKIPKVQNKLGQKSARPRLIEHRVKV